MAIFSGHPTVTCAPSIVPITSIGTRLDFNPISIWAFLTTTRMISINVTFLKFCKMRSNDLSGDFQQRSMRGNFGEKN